MHAVRTVAVLAGGREEFSVVRLPWAYLHTASGSVDVTGSSDSGRWAYPRPDWGSFRISLTYDVPTGTGKTTAHTDTSRGHFVMLVPNEQIVEVDEFETSDPALRGEMTIAIRLMEAEGGTDFLAVHEGLPRWRARPPTTKPAGRWRSGNLRRSWRGGVGLIRVNPT